MPDSSRLGLRSPKRETRGIPMGVGRGRGGLGGSMELAPFPINDILLYLY